MQGVSELRFAATQLSTGVRLHFAEQGDAGGEPIVFLHGWPDSWFSFSRVLPLLPRRYRAYALDQRGAGESEHPPCCYTIDDFAADVIAFLDAVGVERASLVGHSLGSFTARRVAELRPERVARLVLIGSALTARNEVTAEVQAMVRTMEDPVPEAFAREFQAGTAYLPLPISFFDRIVSESLKQPARVWQTSFDGLLAFEDSADLELIQAKTLLLWGERDSLFDRDQQDRLVTAIRGARLITYLETGHCPNWERPEKVADHLDLFMSDC